MIQRLVLLCAFFLIINESSAQRILYIFPDQVEKALGDYFNSLANNRSKYCLTLYKDDGIYTIYVTSFTKSSRKDFLVWVKATTRVALINKNKYPVLLQEDYVFGTPDTSKVGEYGNREGRIKRLAVINEGYSVKFTKTGQIIK